MTEEKKRFIYSLVFPGFFLFLLWAVKFFEVSMELSFVEGGVYPRKLSGLWGILFSPLIHGDWKHLIDNSMPVFLLSVALFYFYRDIAYKIWFLIYLIGGILLWSFGRPAYHIGASGLIYGLAAFLFVSGVIRGVRSLMAISLLVVFLYGGMVWGLLPLDVEVSFEAHITGAVAGVILALVYRDQGPEPEVSLLEEDEEEEVSQNDAGLGESGRNDAGQEEGSASGPMPGHFSFKSA
ncbi:MAG: rhomboid family intramembrane serine protease [Bacteroidales bacterium]